MTASTTRDFAATQAAIYQTLTNADQRAGWLEGELVALLVELDQAIELGDTGRLLHHAAMLARCHAVPTPALQRAVEADHAAE